MKRLTIILLASFLLATSVLAGLELGQTQLSGTYWFRWSYENSSENYFALERGYFRIEHQFKRNIKFRFTADFHSTSSANYRYAAALRLKDAYVQFSNFPMKYMDLMVGLQPNYFGMVQDWDYLAVVKAFEDQEHLVSSRDYGISVGGYLPEGWGKWRLEITNGEYYTKSGTDLNTKPAFIVDFRLTPIAGLTIAGSYLTTKDGFATKDSPYTDRNIYTIWTKFAYGPVRLHLQYLGAEKLGRKMGGYRIYPLVNLSKKLQLVAIYDYFDPDLNVSNTAHSRYLAGLNYFFIKKKGKMVLGLQGVYLKEKYENGGDLYKVMIQLTIQPKSKPF